MDEGTKIGLLANLPRIKAQKRIADGLYDETDHQQVYALFMLAYDDEELARKAQSRAAEALVERETSKRK